MSISYHNAGMKKGYPQDVLIKVANDRGLIIPSNKVFTPFLFNRDLWDSKTDLITGTVVAMMPKNKPFTREVVWKPHPNIIKRFIVPDQHVGKENCRLFIVQGFDGKEETAHVEIKNKKHGYVITYDNPDKYVTCLKNMPLEKGRYVMEGQFFMPAVNAPGPDAFTAILTEDRHYRFVGAVMRRYRHEVKFFPPSEIIDLVALCPQEAKTMMFDAANYRLFVEDSERLHQMLLKPTVLASPKSGTIHLTLGYGVEDRLAMENQIAEWGHTIKDIAKSIPLGIIEASEAIRELKGGQRFMASIALKAISEGLFDHEQKFFAYQAKNLNEAKKLVVDLFKLQKK